MHPHTVTKRALALLLGKPDNDALRPADVGEPVRIIALHFTNELGSLGAHVCNESIEVIDGEHETTDAQRVHWRVHWPEADRVGGVELVQLNALPVRGPQQDESGSDILEPDQAAE